MSCNLVFCAFHLMYFVWSPHSLLCKLPQILSEKKKWNISQGTKKTKIFPWEDKPPIMLAKIGKPMVYARKRMSSMVTSKGNELIIPAMTIYW